jgi:hypothetical protein
MRSPTSIWGSEAITSSSVSQADTWVRASSNASKKSVVWFSASARKARPNQVMSDSDPQPNEVRSLRAAVMTRVSGLASAST